MKIWRKIIIRLLMGTAFLLLFLFTGSNIILMFVIGLLCVNELIRLNNKKYNFYLFKEFRLYLKAKERNKFSTIPLFFIGILLPLLLFRKEIAVAATLFLIYGDFFAELIGTRFGKTKIFREKSLEGSLGCFVSCVIIGLILNLGWVLILIGSLVATLAELYAKLIKLDDNLTVGVISGLVMSLI